MDSSTQFNFWLYPIAILAALSLVVRLQLGFKWAWAFILQALLLLSVSTLGFFFAPSWIFAGSGWIIFAIFFAIPRLILSRLESSLNLLNTQAALKQARWLRFFFWGEPGRFWKDMVKATSHYIKGEGAEAEAILESWCQPWVPKNMRETVSSFRVSGRVIMWDWNGILAEYQQLKASGAKIPNRLLMSASRAYAEVGQIKEAGQCLEQARLSESRLGREALALALLPFFCLSGAKSNVDKIFKILAKGRQPLPDYSRLYWQGRCYAIAGDTDRARQLLEEAAKQATSSPEAWQNRIRIQLERISPTSSSPTTGAAATNPAPAPPAAPSPGADPSAGVDSSTESQSQADQEGVGEAASTDASTGSAHPEWEEAVARVWAVFEQSVFVQEIISPKGASYAVNTIIIIIIIAYVVTDLSAAHPTSSDWLYSHLEWLHMGALFPDKVVYGGEYWRIVTYMFLHSSVTHVLLNILGLYWFGRVAENIYGTPRFVAIYLVSGMLSGIAHVLVQYGSPHAQVAVGASGAVMGVFGAVAAGIVRLKGELPRTVRQSELAWMAGLALAQIILDQLIPHVASVAHLGGLLAGFCIGFVLSVPSMSTARSRVEYLIAH